MENTKEVLREVEEALVADSQEVTKRTNQEAADNQHKLERGAKMGALLRIIGSTVLLAAAATFLLQQWGEISHMVRCFSFLGFTALLSAAGFFCGMRMKEDKGARTFLALAAAVIPVHFAQLGGMLYSQFIPAGQHVNYPAQLMWQAPSLSGALIAVIVGLIVMAPVMLISFTTLARSVAWPTAIVYLIANAFLLIPTREPDMVALLGVLMAAIILLYDNHLHGNAALKTREGAFVRVMLAVPFALLVGRTLHLYMVTEYFCSMLFAVSGAGLFLIGKNYIKEEAPAAFLQNIALVPLSFGWITFAMEAAQQLRLADDIQIPLIGLPLAVIFTAISLYERSGGRFPRAIAAVTAIMSVSLQLMIFPGIFSSLLCITSGIFVTVYGHATEQKAFFVSGIGGLVFGLLYHLKYAAELYTMSPWMTLAALGIATVMASSYVEKNFFKLAEQIKLLGRQVKEWR